MSALILPLFTLYLDVGGEHNMGRLTRSSPIGPAEHDEGGSLVPKAGQSKGSV
jgi:hypothetical protein